MARRSECERIARWDTAGSRPRHPGAPGPARAALRRALRRRQAVHALQRAARLVLATAHGPIEIAHGRLVLPDDDDLDTSARVAFDETLVIARWIARPGTRVCVEYAEGVCASELPAIPA